MQDQRRRTGVSAPHRLGLVGFHFFFYAVGQLFDLFRFLDNVQGEGVFVGFVDVFFQLGGELEQCVGVALQLDLALVVQPSDDIFVDSCVFLIFGSVRDGSQARNL